jgi:urocanate hydratase
VNNGLVRRAWARNPGARFAVGRAMQTQPSLAVTLPHQADDRLVEEALARADDTA